MDKAALIARMLDVIEHDIAPMTQREVRRGNKVFGAAILRKNDLSLVIAETNNEIENPLWHGEMHALKKLYERKRDDIPDPRDCLFIATHEPCSLCLSAITWAGYDNFYYLFSYEDSRDSFDIPHDLRILHEVFAIEDGNYRRENAFWKANDLVRMIAELDRGSRETLVARIDEITAMYADFSEIYQAAKDKGDIPLN
jgi:tRNA(Arg) A34 adenosine deaminase TadA